MEGPNLSLVKRWLALRILLRPRRLLTPRILLTPLIFLTPRSRLVGERRRRALKGGLNGSPAGRKPVFKGAGPSNGRWW
ncbi:hypothetical protein SAMN04487912_10792 [Arthrobacter sp. cf158]|nr:hypothetical protein SAMN04487912_10792 [Arthrobacter sp. cf158]